MPESGMPKAGGSVPFYLYPYHEAREQGCVGACLELQQDRVRMMGKVGFFGADNDDLRARLRPPPDHDIDLLERLLLL